MIINITIAMQSLIFFLQEFKLNKKTVSALLTLVLLSVSAAANAGDYEDQVSLQIKCKEYGEYTQGIYELKELLPTLTVEKLLKTENPSNGVLLGRLLVAGYDANSKEDAHTMGWAICMDRFGK